MTSSIRRTLAMAALLASGSAAVATPQSLPRIEPVECATLSSIPADQKATCGVLLVPENRARPTSPTLRLPFVKLHSWSASPQRDPVVFMSGGPGNSTIRPRLSGRGIALLDERDYIFFEQRGAKLAVPNLMCAEWDQVEADATIGKVRGEEVKRRKVAAIKACGDRARASGIDLRMYDSTASAADVNDLRVALGLDQLNLYGLSYSASIMMRVVRDFPKTVRSIVLNSPLPVEDNDDEHAAESLARSLELVFSGCALQADCERAFPNPRAQMIEIIARADRKPVTLELPASQSEGKAVKVTLRGRGMGDALLSTLGEPDQIEVLPRIIDQVYRGDYHSLASLISIGSNQAALLRRTVWCNEESPFENLKIIASQDEARYAQLGLSEAGVHIAGVCEALGLSDIKRSAVENQPVVTDVPTLIFSGEFDPWTAVPTVRQMLASLANGFQVVVPGNTHNAGFSRCAMKMSAEFYHDPSRVSDASCLFKVKGPDFSRAAQPEKPQAGTN